MPDDGFMKEAKHAAEFEHKMSEKIQL